MACRALIELLPINPADCLLLRRRVQVAIPATPLVGLVTDPLVDRPQVEAAKRRTKTRFIEGLTKGEAEAIRRVLSLSPERFWRAATGREFLQLPPRLVQQEFDFGNEAGTGDR